jgi:hypothetical protein
MSTRAQLRTALSRRLGNRGEFTDTDKDKWIDDGLLDLCTRRVTLRSLERIGTPVASQVGIADYARPPDAFALHYLVDTGNNKVLDHFEGTFEAYLKATMSEMPTVDTVPTHFAEWGPKFYIFNTPQVNTITWTPYYYARPSLGTGANDIPDIEVEWHYPIEIIAAAHAFKDIGDEERSNASSTEFDQWLLQRDTNRRNTARQKSPLRGVRPLSTRSSRTGV